MPHLPNKIEKGWNQKWQIASGECQTSTSYEQRFAKTTSVSAADDK